MPGNYAPQLATVQRLLAAKGTVVTLRHYPATGPVTQNRLTGALSGDGRVDYRVPAVSIPIKMPRASGSGASKDSGGLVLSDMRTVYIAGSGWTDLSGAAVAPVLPHKPDELLGLEGINWTIELCSGLAPSGLPYILFTARVTR